MYGRIGEARMSWQRQRKRKMAKRTNGGANRMAAKQMVIRVCVCARNRIVPSLIPMVAALEAIVELFYSSHRMAQAL